MVECLRSARRREVRGDRGGGSERARRMGLCAGAGKGPPWLGKRAPWGLGAAANQEQRSPGMQRKLGRDGGRVGRREDVGGGAWARGDLRLVGVASRRSIPAGDLRFSGGDWDAGRRRRRSWRQIERDTAARAPRWRRRTPRMGNRSP